MHRNICKDYQQIKYLYLYIYILNIYIYITVRENALAPSPFTFVSLQAVCKQSRQPRIKDAPKVNLATASILLEGFEVHISTLITWYEPSIKELQLTQ